MNSITPPKAQKREFSHDTHGDIRRDPYHWMRSARWQEVLHNPDVLEDDIRAYLDAENAYTDAAMAAQQSLCDELEEEMRARILEDDAGVRHKDGEWEYWYEYHAGQQYQLHMRATGGQARVLLDENELARGREFFDMALLRHSDDHRMIAYAADYNGSEYYELYIRPAEGGDAQLVHRNTAGDAVWCSSSRRLFYVTLDGNHRPHQVRCYDTQSGDDTPVYEEGDGGYFLDVGRTSSRRFITIISRNAAASEIRVIDMEAGDAPPRVIIPREDGVKAQIEHHGQHFYLLSNMNGAADYKISRMPVDTAGIWEDVIPHEAGRLIEDMHIYSGHLVYKQMKDAQQDAYIAQIGGAPQRLERGSDEVGATSLIPSYEFDTKRLIYRTSSMATPPRIMECDMQTGVTKCLKEETPPAGYTPGAYETRRIFATAHDGAQVPVTLLYRAGVAPGAHPCVLYGYGSYGYSVPPAFSPNRLSLVDRGFVYAVAHIRGGKECGEAWYEAGKKLHKKNTFEDFISCAEHLIDGSYTTPQKLCAHGGSAGGMLMGAVVNKRPDLFHAVVADVPFVDVLTTICDGDLPLTPPEWEEWGNPLQNRDVYEYMKSYSPYDNVTAQHYPHMLVTAGLTDPRVTYWEPAKWVARLREVKIGEGALLLKTNMGAGHGGASGRYGRLKEVAFMYGFLLSSVK